MLYTRLFSYEPKNAEDIPPNKNNINKLFGFTKTEKNQNNINFYFFPYQSDFFMIPLYVYIYFLINYILVCDIKINKNKI